MTHRVPCAIAAMIFALSLRAAGETRQDMARQVLLKATERLRWQNYWLPNTVDKSYVPGKEIRVLARFSKFAAGFCASALGFCQIYKRKPDGNFQFQTEWAASGESYDSARRFSKEYSKAQLMEIAPPPGEGRGAGRHAFDVTKMAESHPSQQDPFESFDSELSWTWRLMPLDPPQSISHKIAPSDANTFRTEVIKTAKDFSTRCSTPAHGTIPYYSPNDPRVFVYVDLGKGCEKGVFEFMRRPDGGWNFNRFVADPIDLHLLVPRIRKAAMETFTLPD